MRESGAGADRLGIGAGVPLGDGGRERTGLLVRKWDEDQTLWAARKLDVPARRTVRPHQFGQLGVAPFEVSEWHGNLITRAGWGDLFTGFFGSQATLFSATVGRIGIGTSSTAATAADVALTSIGSMTGNNWILCGANPTLNSGVSPCTVVFTATFGLTDAVGAWNEFAIDHGTAATASTAAVGHMINHSSWSSGGPGTKGSATWTATATLSFT